ncbi:hypothetical protein [Zooshikella harenae]|uniref:Glycosyltransferase RgtA/B/C/D-like domain-containing protein n=1 Tax=Zooshikella harenae TaxID=2827238 RepID=A0ABS5Z8C6_9GAMM|nr:hypothetical protein [Zooshikella harenae]MBU2710245.1 hypothetical protein [Zooshikella harenae]
MTANKNQDFFSNSAVVVLFFCALLLTLYVYWPSLNGPFVFDDIPNLEALGAFGGVDSLEKALIFIFDGKAGPLGRPLALTSFLLNDTNWPSNAEFSFKYTNVLIHCLVGVLIFVFARKIIFLAGVNKDRANIYAIFVMIFWLLHPMNISGVLLVVQRMNQLATGFMLIFFIYYLYNRNSVVSFDKSVYFFSICGAIFIAAILSKETAALIPIYLCVLEIVLQGQRREKNDWIQVFIVYIGGLAFIGLLFFYANFDSFTWQVRGFTPLERLMTESRILIDYLDKIVRPSSVGSGFVNDDIILSKNLFEPITTVLSIIFVASLLVVALFVKNKLVKFGIFWFFGGHLLESTCLPLELYFEHRNYLPMVGIIIALVGILDQLKQKEIVYGVMCVLVLISLILSRQSAVIWGDSSKLAKVLFVEHPNSKRAYQSFINERFFSGDMAAVKYLIASGKEKFPGDNYMLLQSVIVGCDNELNFAVENEDIKRKIISGYYDNGSIALINTLSRLARDNKCREVNYDFVEDVIDGFLLNKFYKGNYDRSILYSIKHDLYIHKKIYKKALYFINKSVKLNNKNHQLMFKKISLLSALEFNSMLVSTLKEAMNISSGNYFKDKFYRDIYASMIDDLVKLEKG